MPSEAQGNLTHKRRRFAEEYVVDSNATQAAKRAGYSERTAYSQGNRLLKNADVASYVRELQSEISERTHVDAEKIVRELAKLGFSDVRELARWDEYGVVWRDSSTLTDEAAASVRDVLFTREVRYDKNGERIETTQTRLALHDKKAALKMLADHVGLFDKGQGKEGDEFDRLLEAITSDSEAQED